MSKVARRTGARKPSAKKSNTGKPEKERCRGFCKDGTPCRLNAHPGSTTCAKHTPGYTPKTGDKKDRDAKHLEILKKLEAKIQHREKLGKYKFKEEVVISGNPLGEFAVATFVDVKVKKDIAKIIASDTDNSVLYLADSARSPQGKVPNISGSNRRKIDYLALGRRHWQKIGWILEQQDRKSYAELALTCKTLYDILCGDKVWAYYHPLKTRCIHPLMLMMPHYRIVQFEMIDQIDMALKDNKLPTLIQLIDFESNRLKGLEVKQFMRQCGIMAQELMEALFKEMLGKDEFVPTIDGGGIFEDIRGGIDIIKSDTALDYNHIPPRPVLDFVDPVVPFYCVKGPDNKSNWLIAKSLDPEEDRTIHTMLEENLVGFDGKRIIRLMRY